MSRYIVTGGAGFIGSHLCETLLEQGNDVTIIDSFNEFYPSVIKYGNLKSIEKKCLNINGGNLLVETGDIRDESFLDTVFSKNKVDGVIHLAAYAGVRPSIENPELYCDVNIKGTMLLLEAIRKWNIKRLVFASSSSVYGGNEKVPFSEADPVDHPISPYAATKKAGELMCYTYSHLYGINTACLRFFTVYGPRQRPDLAIYKFTRLIFEGREIPFYGDGETRRDYTYIEDIVDGILKAIEWTSLFENKYDVFNLGENQSISLKEMVAEIENVVGKAAKLKVFPSQPGDIRITNADITKAKNILGYDPKTKFSEGVKQFVVWYMENRLDN